MAKKLKSKPRGYYTGKIYCTHCRKFKWPRKNVLSDLALEVPSVVAAICPKCKKPMFHKYSQRFYDMRHTRIIWRTADYTREGYAQKYEHLRHQ